MGLWDILRRLFSSGPTRHEPPLPPPDQGRPLDELARHLALPAADLLLFCPAYHQFTIPKRTGGERLITAPEPTTKVLQRRLLRRVLARLPVHPAALGFRPGESIVTHARLHAGRAVVLRMDLRDFFPSITAPRVHAYFRRVGWNDQAAQVLVKLCTHEGALPQGAPTSPHLSNLVNYRLDARLTGMAHQVALTFRNPKTLKVARTESLPEGAIVYSRYADDLTFSFAADHHALVNTVVWLTQHIVKDEGYRLHTDKKLRVMRRHARQTVTGLVVNQAVNLPRRRRRWLRAVEHHLSTGRPATLEPAQLAGWLSLQHMILTQGAAHES